MFNRIIETTKTKKKQKQQKKQKKQKTTHTKIVTLIEIYIFGISRHLQPHLIHVLLTINFPMHFTAKSKPSPKWYLLLFSSSETVLCLYSFMQTLSLNINMICSVTRIISTRNAKTNKYLCWSITISNFIYFVSDKAQNPCLLVLDDGSAKNTKTLKLFEESELVVEDQDDISAPIGKELSRRTQLNKSSLEYMQ